MKFFIFICCIAHLQSDITAKLWRTTPMSSVNRKRWNDDEVRQVSKFAAMIDFVNNVYNENDDGSSFVRRHGPSKRHISRSFDEPALNRFVNVNYDKDTNAKLDKMADIVRYHVIENPEVLLSYKNKQKKDLRKSLDAVDVFSEIKSFSTAENKLNDFPSQIERRAVLHDNAVTTANPAVILHNDDAPHIRAHQDDEDRITDEVAYRPSFPNDDDDEKPKKEGINLAINNKENFRQKPDKKDHGILPEIINNHEFGKKTQNNKALGKKNKNKAYTNIPNKTGSIKNEYSATKQIYSHEKLNKDSVRPKNKHNDSINKKDGITNKNIEKHKKGKNKRYLSPVERLILNIDDNGNNDHIKLNSIYAHKERTENRNKHYNNRKENKDKYDTKKNDRHNNKREEKHSLWIKVDSKNDEKLDTKEKKWDKNPDKWSKKVKELDNKWSKNDKDKVFNEGSRSKKEKKEDQTNDKYIYKEKNWDANGDKLTFDNWSKNDKVKVNKDESWSRIEKKRDKNNNKYSNKQTNWDSNDDRLKKEKDRNKMNKKRNHQDKKIDKMEYEWNKRHQAYDKNADDDNIDNQWNQNDKFLNERDNEFKKRDNEWNKNDGERNKKHDRTNDRNKSGNQYPEKQVDVYKDVVRHGRYKIVDRNSRDSSTNDQ